MAEERNLPAVVSGTVILLDALAARLLLGADDARVYILGHPISWECSMRRIGLPCPTCGLTRGIVLALHGDWVRAWHIAPGGPVLLAGTMLFALALLLFAFRRTPWPRWMRTAGVAYAAAAALIWLGA